MPVLTLRLAAPVAHRTGQALAGALTALSTRTLGKRAEVTAMLIEVLGPASAADEPAPSAWFIGGQPLAQPTALLTIQITAGTNTVAQKAAFVAEAQALLQTHLAPSSLLAEASYVLVHELPASDWGYGGLTQVARRQQSATGR